MEEWVPIEDFPDYEVSDQGRIRNASTKYVLGIYDNGSGVMQVVMRRAGRPTARAVHKLVARAFLDPAPEDCIPMHIDKDRENNSADNLVYKPRWFVVKHTLQHRRTKPVDPRKILAVKTGIIYDNALVCAKELGGLEHLVLITARDRFGSTYLGTSFEFLR